MALVAVVADPPERIARRIPVRLGPAGESRQCRPAPAGSGHEIDGQPPRMLAVLLMELRMRIRARDPHVVSPHQPRHIGQQAPVDPLPREAGDLHETSVSLHGAKAVGDRGSVLCRCRGSEEGGDAKCGGDEPDEATRHDTYVSVPAGEVLAGPGIVDARA